MVKEKVIPYRHIQNVDIEQPYHYRVFGIAKLNITTARAENLEQNKGLNLIPIIDKNLARKLSDFLIKQGVTSSNNMNTNIDTE
jgi:membrane protein YdbS with pleckstrin-like domain